MKNGVFQKNSIYSDNCKPLFGRTSIYGRNNTRFMPGQVRAVVKGFYGRESKWISLGSGALKGIY